MTDKKEKSAVGTAIPATEKDMNNSPENIISGNEEKIKAQNAYKDRISGQDEKIASFIVKQKQPYEFKIKYAELRIREFIRECDRRGLNTHVSVGGLDSITLFLFIKSLGINIPGISVSVLEDKEDGTYFTTKAQRTGCSMCGFGIQLEKRPHRFDYLRQTNPKEWEFWMYRCCIDNNGKAYGWGRVLDYIGIPWEDDAFAQLTFGEVV